MSDNLRLVNSITFHQRLSSSLHFDRVRFLIPQWVANSVDIYVDAK